MRSRLSVPLLLALSIASAARGAADWQAHLPPEWLAVVVVNDVAEFDRHAARIADQFAVDAPGLVRLIEAAGLQGVTDAKASWLAGLARGPAGAEEPYPFAMIPVTDFGEFAAALDGDLRGTTAVVTLADQDLLAGNCGRWALLMNPDQHEILESVIARAPDATLVKEKPLAATSGIAAVNVSHLGLKWLAAYRPTGDERSRQQLTARRKRGMAMLSVEGAKESLVLDKPLWEWVAATFENLGIAVTIDDAGKARVKVLVAKSGAAGKTTSPIKSKNANVFVDREWIALGTARFSPELAELATGWQIATLKSEPDELGVEEFASAELAALEASIKNAFGHVEDAQFAILASPDLPVYGNRALLLEVSNSDDFLAACGEVMQRWNTLIATSKAAVELEFAAEPVEIAGRSGQRFYVDMVEAVDVPRSPEVAKVMADMFGPEGILNWYVLPIEKGQIAVANLPREAVEKLVRDLKTGDPKPQAVEGTATLALDASACVDWAQRRDLTVTGDTIGGPRFVPLPESDPIGASLTVRDGTVEIELVLPPSLVENAGKRAQEAR